MTSPSHLVQNGLVSKNTSGKLPVFPTLRITCEALSQEYQKYDPIPVISLTARVKKGDREKTMAAGCDNYIAKPIYPESFLRKISGGLIG